MQKPPTGLRCLMKLTVSNIPATLKEMIIIMEFLLASVTGLAVTEQTVLKCSL